MSRSRGKQFVVLPVVASVLLFATGCKLANIIQMVTSLLGGGGMSGIIPGGGAGGSPFPGGIGGPGAGPMGPSSLLPPAAGASNATLQKIQQRYGIQVYGSAATQQSLDTIATALQYYKPEHLRELMTIDCQGSTGTGLAGMWSSNGRGGRIQYFGRIAKSTASHELAHHLCEYVDSNWRDQLLNAQGRNNRPTNYSYNTWADFAAELIPTGQGLEQPEFPNFGFTAQAKTFFDQKFAGMPQPF